MLRNYLKIAVRNLWKNKLFSFINIMGLGLAIPFALLSLIHVQNVVEHDNFHLHAERTYRVLTDFTTDGGDRNHYATTPFLLREKLTTTYPGIEKSARVIRNNTWEITNRIKTLSVNGYYADAHFFDLFNFPLAKGSVPVLPNTLVLSHEMANKFFGAVNPVGKILNHPDYGAFTVVGVLKPYKQSTHLRTDAIVSMATFEKFNPHASELKTWGTYDVYTYVLLRGKVAPAGLDAALSDIATQTNPLIREGKQTHQFRRQTLAQISPDAEELSYNWGVESIRDLLINFGQALGIIILAGFNYTNLTLARSLSRSKEVGVRKVMGAIRYQLITQFLSETTLIAFLALVIGFAILTVMKQSIHVQWIAWEVDNQWILWTIFIVFTLLIGLLAGILPAVILSKFQPVKVLKGEITPGSLGKIGFRKSLVVVQFIVTMTFIFLIAHMFAQFRYMATENESFNRKNIFNLTLADKNYHPLLDKLLVRKDVEKVGLTSVPFGGLAPECVIRARQKDDGIKGYFYAVDRNFIENMVLPFQAGENLPLSQSDSAGHFALINEKAVKRLGLKSAQDAIGKTMLLNNQELLIKGVLKDFCYWNYQFEVQPLVFQYSPAHFQVVSIKTAKNTNEDAFVASVQQIWKQQYRYEPMVYAWYEKDLYDRYFPTEDMKFIGLSSLVVFAIAIMGLLGIVTYTTEKRTKEIGIRKVMGASVLEVTQLLSWSFMKLMLIASLIALPIGYGIGFLFLKLFVFHDGIHIALMMGIFGFIFLTALFIIALKSVKSALTNPVTSLRSE